MTIASTTTEGCVRSADSHAEPFQALHDVALRELGASYGTPLFIFDLNWFESSCRSLVDTWQRWFPGGRIYYSYKTNHLPEVCMAAHSCGMGADVVSGYELEHARRYAMGRDIVFNGPMKTEGELRAAVAARAIVNADARDD